MSLPKKLVLACVEYANAYSLLEPTQIVARERVLAHAEAAIAKILADTLPDSQKAVESAKTPIDARTGKS